MRQLVYALRFTGQATPTGPDGTVLVVTATARSLVPTIGYDYLVGALELTPTGEVVLESEMTSTGETSFQEVGTITFGDGHCLRFTAIGSGYLGASPDPTRRHGVVAWRVVGGEGQFAGASGLITSNFFVGQDLGVIGHHLGVLFVP